MRGMGKLVSLQIQRGKSFINYHCGKNSDNNIVWASQKQKRHKKATSFLSPFLTSPLHSQLPCPVQAPWRGIKSGQYIGVPLCCCCFLLMVFLCSSVGTPQAAVSSGISIWSGIALHGLQHGCLLQNRAFPPLLILCVPSAGSHSFCSLLCLGFSCPSPAFSWRYHQLC